MLEGRVLEHVGAVAAQRAHAHVAGGCQLPERVLFELAVEAHSVPQPQLPGQEAVFLQIRPLARQMQHETFLPLVLGHARQQAFQTVPVGKVRGAQHVDGILRRMEVQSGDGLRLYAVAQHEGGHGMIDARELVAVDLFRHAAEARRIGKGGIAPQPFIDQLLMAQFRLFGGVVLEDDRRRGAHEAQQLARGAGIAEKDDVRAQALGRACAAFM